MGHPVIFPMPGFIKIRMEAESLGIVDQPWERCANRSKGGPTRKPAEISLPCVKTLFAFLEGRDLPDRPIGFPDIMSK
jgi:hypothetical protein